MNKDIRYVVAGLSGALAVAFGAFGAHGLKSYLVNEQITPEQLNAFDTGVKYQMYHTLAILTVLILDKLNPSKLLNFCYYLFLWGIVLFSGSLYLLSTRNITGMHWLKILGPITPIGGILFVFAWILLAANYFIKPKKTPIS